MMFTFRSHGGSRAVSRSITDQPHELQQDRQGPLDGELLDLYVAIVIAVPLGCLLKSLWF
jgi:hypothetical protein